MIKKIGNRKGKDKFMEKNKQVPDDVASVMEELEKRGYKAYVVGGAVRDVLLGKTPHDYDITTNATPEEIKSVFAGRCVTFAEKFGTVTVLEGGGKFEVTTFRKESGYSDSRHPDKVEWGKTIEEDLGRRDFTINAMAMDKNGNVIDPFGGQKDLANGFIKCVGYPYNRFKEDNLRILRAARFAALFDGASFDSKTAKAMESYGGKKLNLSAERIRDEFTKMIMSGGFERSVTVLDNLGVLKSVFPEIEKAYDERYGDLNTFGFSVTNVLPKDNLLRWGLVLSCTDNPEKVVSRLKFSNKEKDEILFYAKNRDLSLAGYNIPKIRRFAAENGEYLQKLFTMQEIIEDYKYRHTSEIPDSKKYDNRELCKMFLADGSAILPSQLNITGYDLQELGYKGKTVGLIKGKLYEQVLQCPEFNTKECLVDIAKDWIDGGEIER